LIFKAAAPSAEFRHLNATRFGIFRALRGTHHSARGTNSVAALLAMLLRPRALPPNGHIAVLAASSPSELGRIEIAKRNLEARGFRVSLAPNIAEHHRGYLAGNDDVRLQHLNDALRADDVDAIFFSRGGYGAMRILDRIDYEALRRNPRPVVGFSDITALHQAFAIHSEVASFHGPMLNSDFYNGLSLENDRWCWWMLSGEAPLEHRFHHDQVVSEGEAEGTLFGGCLSITTALTATPYDYWIDGGIWFWEDVDEPVYRIDRMLTHLRLSGRLQKVQGVLIGKLKGCGNEAEQSAFLQEFFGSSGIPVVRDLPFGHYGDNLLLPIGSVVRLSTAEGSLTVTQPVVDRR
jgi:muramoyltetrapeptide carboxypeptidase